MLSEGIPQFFATPSLIGSDLARSCWPFCLDALLVACQRPGHAVGARQGVSFLFEVIDLLTAPHTGWPDGIPNRIAEHLLISGATTIVAVLIGAADRRLLGHIGRGVSGPSPGQSSSRDASLALLALDRCRVACVEARACSGQRSCAGAAWYPPVITIATWRFGVSIATWSNGPRQWVCARPRLSRVELPIAAPLIIAGVRNAAVAIRGPRDTGALLGVAVAWVGILSTAWRGQDYAAPFLLGRCWGACCRCCLADCPPCASNRRRVCLELVIGGPGLRVRCRLGAPSNST